MINHLKNYLFLSSLLTFLVGCDAMDAMKATKNMDGKMNETNRKMDEMNNEMKKTTSAIHNQTLLLALTEMEKDENFRDKNISYFSLPLDLLPGAEVFAKEVTAEEMAKLAFLYMHIVNEIAPNEDMKELDPATGKMVYPKSYANRFDFEKFKKFTVIQAISVFLSQAKVEQIVEEQVYQGGLYEEGAYTILVARAKFLQTIMLEDRILSEGIKNIGKLEEAMNCLRQIEYIYNLPFQEKLRIKIFGMINKSNKYNVTLEEGGTAPLYQKVLTGIEQDLQPQYANLKRVQQIKQEIQNKLATLPNLN